MRCVGTVVRGIRTPIIKKGDNLVDIVVESLMKAKDCENFRFNDGDIIAITEAVVGISEGNYVTVDDIANELIKVFPAKNIGLVFPILSRNRFSMILKGIARAMDKITILLSFPADEVGNGILAENKLYDYGIDLGNIITEEEYKEKFSDFLHPFTGINMIDYYRQLVEAEGCEVEFVLANNPQVILNYNQDILCCDIHNREKTKKIISSKAPRKVLTLADLLIKANDNHGYNPTYGLLGSNVSTEETLKLFPRTGNDLVYEIQQKMKNLTGKDIEVMIYGDGAFKDPVGGIWELADPVVSPAYTAGLIGTPNEIKLKYVSDNKYKDLTGEELKIALKNDIKNKASNLKGNILSQGTTPRRYVDLIGSLADLTSGSGDKGTPVVFIQGYFDNLANE